MASAPHQRQLPIPPCAADDTKAIELLRVWASGGKQHVTIATNLWSDPACWGMLLVDLAKHISNAYEASGDLDRAAALAQIKAGLDAEWGTATDDPSGGLID